MRRHQRLFLRQFFFAQKPPTVTPKPPRIDMDDFCPRHGVDEPLTHAARVDQRRANVISQHAQTIMRQTTTVRFIALAIPRLAKRMRVEFAKRIDRALTGGSQEWAIKLDTRCDFVALRTRLQGLEKLKLIAEAIGDVAHCTMDIPNILVAAGRKQTDCGHEKFGRRQEDRLMTTCVAPLSTWQRKTNDARLDFAINRVIKIANRHDDRVG